MKKTVILVVGTLMFSSCATLFTSSKSTIHFETYPSGAKVEINGIDKGQTPCDVRVRKKLEAPSVLLKLDGYEIKSFDLEQKFQPVCVLNLTNFIGWGIDIATGKIKTYDTKSYSFQLEKKK